MNDAVRALKLQRQIATIQADRQIITELIRNPVVGLVGGLVLLNAIMPDKNIFDHINQTLADTGLIAICTFQALAPSLSTLVEGAGKITEIIGKAVPAIAAGA